MTVGQQNSEKQNYPLMHQSDALAKWSHGHDLSPPDGIAQQKQRAWDTLKVSVTVNTLFETASDENHMHGFWKHHQRSRVHGCMPSQYRLLA